MPSEWLATSVSSCLLVSVALSLQGCAIYPKPPSHCERFEFKDGYIPMTDHAKAAVPKCFEELEYDGPDIQCEWVGRECLLAEPDKCVEIDGFVKAGDGLKDWPAEAGPVMVSEFSHSWSDYLFSKLRKDKYKGLDSRAIRNAKATAENARHKADMYEQHASMMLAHLSGNGGTNGQQQAADEMTRMANDAAKKADDLEEKAEELVDKAIRDATGEKDSEDRKQRSLAADGAALPKTIKETDLACKKQQKKKKAAAKLFEISSALHVHARGDVLQTAGVAAAGVAITLGVFNLAWRRARAVGQRGSGVLVGIDSEHAVE